MQFKATNKQILRDEITFSEIKEVLDILEIDTLDKLIQAKKNSALHLPANPGLNVLCLQKTGLPFIEYFNFKISKTKQKFKVKLLDGEFIEELKNWCNENSIESVTQYIQASLPRHFPSAERIRQIYSKEYFSEVLGIGTIFFTKEEARNICKKNGIIVFQHYLKFYQKFNQSSEIKLPSSPYQYYNTDWTDFIQLSETQLFIGNSISSLELFTYKWLFDRNIKFEMQKTYDDCRSINPLPFDFYLPEINTIIEVDGKQHDYIDENQFFFSKNTKKHDNIKNKYCKTNGIKLIRIKGIQNIKQRLEDEINLDNHPITKDLDWTLDFNEPGQVLSSELSNSTKVQLLLLMCEKGRCDFTNSEIIEKVGCFKSTFYGVKNKLIELSLINRETDYYIDDKQKSHVIQLYKMGYNLSRISRVAKVKRYNKIIEILENNGVEYKSNRMSKNDIEKIKQGIIKLFKQGKSNSFIYKKIGINQSYCSQIITNYKIENGLLKPSEKERNIIEQYSKSAKEGVSKNQICNRLGISRPYLDKCLKFKK